NSSLTPPQGRGSIRPRAMNSRQIWERSVPNQPAKSDRSSLGRCLNLAFHPLPRAYGPTIIDSFWEFAMRHVLSALVQNVPGVLSHISGMLASRGYNIDSLAVGETEDPHLSRMTFVVVGDDAVLAQVRKQLEKIV